MVLSFFHRHPRYVIALGVGLLVLFLLGASDHSSLGYPPRIRYEALGSRSSLESRLEQTERDYQAVIARRPELIKKYGGNVKNIEPCVPCDLRTCMF
jgi:hypothetical protein